MRPCARGVRSCSPRPIPQVSATGPGQVLCWDITWLPQSYFGKGLHLYTVLDLYSRKIVAWTIQHVQKQQLANALIAKAIDDLGKSGKKVQVVHTDNGKVMTSNTMKDLLAYRGVSLSLIRPNVSNDNAFEEASHRTIKHHRWAREVYPTMDDAVATIGNIINEYNFKDRHRGLNGFTPQQVFDGSWEEILDTRVSKYAPYYAKHPERRPSKYGLCPPPHTVGINIGKQPATTLEPRHLHQLADVS
ncbi:DDE-type integrase/transposase/recombinase [Corynebacterium sp. H130]|uniref:DDE-type integrase/transposase/recombinase n=1 Tax=Corynebacterium sp. H130 TaxID=3133444 RepID=UPI0030999E1F